MRKFIHYNELESVDPLALASSPLIWVPGEAVACHQVTVPPVSKKKWQAMIPWLLEEHVLEPPESLVCKSGEKDADNCVPVIAVSRSQLEEWQQRLEHRVEGYSALVPDFFALPWREGKISVGFVNGRCLARFNRWQGATGDQRLILPLVKAAAADRCASVIVFYQESKPPLESELIEAWQFEPVTDIFSPAHGDWLSIADGERGGSQLQWSAPAKVASVLTVALLGLLAANSFVASRQIAQQVDFLQDELRRGYRQYFGQDYDFAMKDFQRVASSRLDSESNANPGDPVTMTKQLASWLQGCSDCQLQQLDVGEGRLSASLAGQGVEQKLSSLADNDPRLSLKSAESGWQLTYVSGMEPYE